MRRKPRGVRLPCFSHTGKAKKRFESLDEASTWISENNQGGQFKVYECPECSGVHLSNKIVPGRKN